MRHLIYEIFFEGIGTIAIVLFSIIYPIYKNKHFLSSNSKKILYKNPLHTFLILLAYGLIMELFLYVDLDILGHGEGFDMLAMIIWPTHAAIAIPIITLFMFLLSLGIYFKKRS